MNRAQRLVIVLTLPILVFVPFYWHTGCLLGNWRCEETRPFLMTLAGIAVLIISGLVRGGRCWAFLHDFDAISVDRLLNDCAGAAMTRREPHQGLG